MKIIPKATHACVFIECPITGMYLGVSRKHDHNDFGLPGGTLEDETETMCAHRELLEETGVFAPMQHMREVFRHNDCVTFRIDFNYVYKKRAPEEGGGAVAWVTEEQLMQGSFGEYNWKLLEALGKIK